MGIYLLEGLRNDRSSFAQKIMELCSSKLEVESTTMVICLYLFCCFMPIMDVMIVFDLFFVEST